MICPACGGEKKILDTEGWGMVTCFKCGGEGTLPEETCLHCGEPANNCSLITAQI